MFKHFLAICMGAGTIPCVLAAGEGSIVPEINGWGTVRSVRVDGYRFPVSTGMDVSTPRWEQVRPIEQWAVGDVQFSEGETLVYSGRIPIGESAVAYRHSIRTDDQGVWVKMEGTATSSMPIEALRAMVIIPAGEFAGAEVELLGTPAPLMISLPEERGDRPHLITGEATGVQVRKDNRRLAIRFDHPRRVTVQDERHFGMDQFRVYFMMQTGELAKGQTVSAELLLRPEVTVDDRPIELEVDGQRELYELHGFGGNFVYGSQSQASKYNLDTLNVAWGRVWMPLHLWEPENDNDDAGATDMEKLAANDKPRTNLRHSLEMAQELQRRKIPYIISIWGVPTWMHANPEKDRERKHGVIISREMWDELAESIGSYLLYAREKYGVEPGMFSFNEPDYGVTVKLTPEEHRDLVIHLGRHFQKLGLKTRFLAADVAHARGTAKFAEPVLKDERSAGLVDAIGFHTWGGASPAQYREWREIAIRSGKPLMVTEAGVDAQAWRFPATFGTYWYGFAEARQYMELLQHAWPQAILLWEYTDDYGILKIDRSTNPPTVTPTKRYFFMRHFAAFTPRNGKVLQSRSSDNEVLIAAVRGKDGRLVLHILNDGPARRATLKGAEDLRFSGYVTDPGRDMDKLEEISGEIELPATSMITLVTKH